MLACRQNYDVMHKYKELYISFPTTRQHQIYGHKYALTCYLKPKKEVVLGSHLYLVLKAREEEIRQCFPHSGGVPRRPPVPLYILSISAARLALLKAPLPRMPFQ